MVDNNTIQSGYEEGKSIQSGSLDTKLITSNIEFRGYFQSHLKEIFKLYEENFFKSFIESYKAYHLDETDRGKALASKGWDWRTNVKYPLTKMVIDTLFANFYDTQITYKITPRNPEDYKKSAAAQGFFERVMDISDGNGEVFKAAKEAMICGTSFLKVIVKKTSEKGVYLKSVVNGKKIYGKYNNEKIYPSISNVDVFSLFIDPSANDIEDARYIFQRKIMPYKDAFKKYGALLGVKFTEEERNTILKNPEYISTKDYSKIKKLPFFKDNIQDNIVDFEWSNFFEVGYNNNDLIEVIEYYEKGKLLLLLNGYIVYDGVSVYPFKGYPFTKINYELDTGGLYTKGIGSNLEQFQKISDIILNSYLDQVKLNVAPMYEMDKGSVADKYIGDKGQLNYVPFKIIEKRDDKTALKPISMVNGDNLGLEALQILQQYVELSEGPNQYSMGGSPVERSATGATLKANITKQRLKPLVDSINRGLSNISEKILLLAATVFNGSIPIKILGQKGEIEFKNISPDDIIGQYNIIFETNSLKTVIKEIEKNQLLQFISQAIPASVDQIRNRPVIDTFKLFRSLIQAFDIPEDVLLTDKDFEKLYKKNLQMQQELQAQMNQNMQQGGNNQQGGGVPPQQQGNGNPEENDRSVDIEAYFRGGKSEGGEGGKTLGELLAGAKSY